ncbi:nitrogen regulatory protein P-II [Syntrophobotulus glycolicus DSM 8271]|uniref:Nitrogen regulatory protein P-II n=1 Tax=Syntrophobotulus glycolicus (strain DSM 8271 / FlGlyR) TaxID=645991 RepID=F0T189_SYNGF|nr:P-II family nitrogen regulator [Syntrophobotulus glycolicus]ADY55153.1 nitrogen regulatory protein P-II [Syntrophobotulus glycolicus DSM 8271]
MVMIEAFVRPEKTDFILACLLEQGFPAVTRVSVLGRGKQKGLKANAVYYGELPKELIIMIVEDKDEDKVVEAMMKSAKTGDEGAYGDGKIFVTPVSSAYTISSGKAEL